MKKTALLILLLFIIISHLVLPSRLFDGEIMDTGAVFKFPDSLVTIENEAFEGTAVKKAMLADKLKSIGERAFADNYWLDVVCIPESVAFIAGNAFDGTVDLTIQGSPDSYAAHWANEHDIRYVPTEAVPMWIQKIGKILRLSTIAFLPFNSAPFICIRRRIRNVNADRSMRPQDRPELYPIDFRFP